MSIRVESTPMAGAGLGREVPEAVLVNAAPIAAKVRKGIPVARLVERQVAGQERLTAGTE